jgi:hypothetical protein
LSWRGTRTASDLPSVCHPRRMKYSGPGETLPSPPAGYVPVPKPQAESRRVRRRLDRGYVVRDADDGLRMLSSAGTGQQNANAKSPDRHVLPARRLGWIDLYVIKDRSRLTGIDGMLGSGYHTR